MNCNDVLIDAKKIVSIGNAGGGKSTICRQLSKTHKLPLYAIDHIQWQPGWVRVPIDEYAKKHEAFMQQDKWIIDGFGPWDFVKKRFFEADVIIYVDLPIIIHFYWSTKRQFKCLFKPRIDGPPGCPMLPMTFKLYKMIWYIHKHVRPKLQMLIKQFSYKKIIHIKTTHEVNQLIRELK